MQIVTVNFLTPLPLAPLPKPETVQDYYFTLQYIKCHY